MIKWSDSENLIDEIEAFKGRVDEDKFVNLLSRIEMSEIQQETKDLLYHYLELYFVHLRSNPILAHIYYKAIVRDLKPEKAYHSLE